MIGVLGDDTYSILYISSHEKAYKWGMNKRAVWNENTDAFQLITVEETVEHVSMAQPAAPDTTPSIFSDCDDEKILKIGVPETCVERVRGIRSLDDLEQHEGILPIDAYENIFYILDGESIDSVIETVEAGKAANGQDKLLSDNNKRMFVELTDDDDLRNIIEQGLEKWQIFLHPSQRKLVNADYKGTMKVSGGAGTGKTVAAIHRLKHLCEAQDANVLFTTYTKALSVNIADAIEKLGVARDKYYLGNIDKVLIRIARKYNVMAGCDVLDYSGEEESIGLWEEVLKNEESDFDAQFLHNEYINVIVYHDNKNLKQYLSQRRVGRAKSLSRKQRTEIWALVEKYVALKRERNRADRLELFNETTNYLNANDIHPFTNVIVDEFQDFSNPELRFVRALAPKGRNDLFFTGDPMQRIYMNRKMNFSQVGINVRGVRSTKLKINYRTTEPIRRTATSIVRAIDIDDLNDGIETTEGYISLIHNGVAPVYEIAADTGAETARVSEWLKECLDAEVSPSEICIAALSSKHLKPIVSELRDKKIKHRLIKGDQKEGDTDGVSLCSFHSLKGLEYRVVILTGVNETSFPSVATEGYPFADMDENERRDFLASKRALMYVAITRARQLVYIIGTGRPTGLLMGVMGRE